jgi:flagellar biosynthetic protein FliP
MKKILLIAAAFIMIAVVLTPVAAHAFPVPTLNINVEEADSPTRVATVIQILLLLTVLALAPSILVLMTSFVRLVVVFSFLRHAMGTQTMPPNQVIVGLSLFLTFFVMMPVWTSINDNAFKPYMANEITQDEALNRASGPVREFMFRQTREKDLALFMSLAKNERPADKSDVPTTSLIPAFVISELRTAFTIGFILYVPFLIIDMVVASVLLSMGMMMLPPIMISLPFKLMLFVLVDGWHLVVGSLVKSFG